MTDFLELADGRRLAYNMAKGSGPAVIFFSGFGSDKSGAKATAILEYCAQNNRECITFDYTGHGESSGDFHNGSISSWLADCKDVISLTSHQLVLVGSSMGGWLSLLTALHYRDRLAAWVGIAPAPDFTEELIWQKLTLEQRNYLMQSGSISLPTANGEFEYTITSKLIEESRPHLIMSYDEIDLGVPCRLIHGMADTEVPFAYSLRLAEKLCGDVKTLLIKNGDHRMSSDNDIQNITKVLSELLGY